MGNQSLRESIVDQSNDFQQNVQKLLDLVEPYIYNDLLPQARQVVQSDRLQVGDVFLRRYGQDCEEGRQGISPHYDVFSKVTSVIAMDNVAAQGNNGLFTTAAVASNYEKMEALNEYCTSTTSNHASLRRYFPLQEGDAVTHTWDVLHGVNVLPGIDRTRLIVWFTEEPSKEESNKDGIVSPWLVQDPNRVETADVTQFVLASASESANDIMTTKSERGDAEDGSVFHQEHVNNGAMHQSSSTSFGHPASSHKSRIYNSQELYLKSATRENSFALSLLGRICERGSWSSLALQEQAKDVLNQIRPMDSLPSRLRIDLP